MEIEHAPTYRRSLRLTHRKFQLSFLLLCFGIGIVTTITSVIAMRLMVTDLSESIPSIRSLDWDQIEDMLRNEANKATLMMVIASLVNIAFTAAIGFYFSHHVAGILHRITITLQKWSSGESVAKIVPRQGDFFLELVEEVNEVIKEPKAKS